MGCLGRENPRQSTKLMNLGIAMRWDVLQDKRDEGRVRQRDVAT